MDDLVSRINKLLRTFLLPAVLTLGSCSSEPNSYIEKQLDCNFENEEMGENDEFYLSFESIDSSYEPDLELSMEEEHNIDILGHRDVLSDESLTDLDNHIRHFQPQQVEGLPIIIDGRGLPNWAGGYRRYKCGVFVHVVETKSNYFDHEIFHHISYSEKARETNFFEKWEKIPVKVLTEDGCVEMTNKEARNYFKNNEIGVGTGISGFMRDYSLNSVLEDVANYAILIHQKPNWDYENINFSLEPFIAKIGLISGIGGYQNPEELIGSLEEKNSKYEHFKNIESLVDILENFDEEFDSLSYDQNMNSLNAVYQINPTGTLSVAIQLEEEIPYFLGVTLFDEQMNQIIAYYTLYDGDNFIESSLNRMVVGDKYLTKNCANMPPEELKQEFKGRVHSEEWVLKYKRILEQGHE